MFIRSWKIRLRGFTQYSGTDEEICKQIIQNCWNGKFFQVSNGHFKVFYTRDFFWCTKPLIQLGYKKEVKKTLAFVLETFEKNGKVTTSINLKGKPFDFPKQAIDSLPCLVRSLRLLNDKGLIQKYKKFLGKEAEKLYVEAVDEGMVNPNKYFSSIKDHSKRKSSCYDNCMIAMLAEDLAKLKISDGFKGFDYIQGIKENFWTGEYFKNDIYDDSITGDANVFPYYCELFTDPKMIKKSIKSIQNEELDLPFPLKYHQKTKKHKMNFYNIFAPDYETNSIWAHIGLTYIDVVSKVNPSHAKKYLKCYKENIDRYKTVLEVYNKEGRPYRSLFYYTDESMSWASLYLIIKKRIKL